MSGFVGRGTSPVTLEEELRQIENEIRKLKIAFDLYFIGSNPKPPLDQRDQLDRQIKKLQSVQIKSLGDRFLYNSIVNRFNAFSELWAKSMRVREEGARVHPLAARAAHHSAAAENGGSFKPGPAPKGPRPAREKVKDSWRVPTDRRDEAAVRNLYENFIAAKNQVGDRKQPSFEAFAREIGRHAAAIKGKIDCQAIDFKLDFKDNKVSIKAKPAK